MWVLIVLTAYYNPAVASVDFFTKEACQLAAQEVLKAGETDPRLGKVKALCTPKGDTKSYDGWQTQTEKALCAKLRSVGQECL